jgi:(E)-4-hydroxy-3-methylbut-2-enyl-diphosphate synthase
VNKVLTPARDHGCWMRIGVNAGSLEPHVLETYGEPCPDAMVESALDHARILEDHDFHEFKISVKASDVFMAVAAYQQLAEAVDCPLHVGITEAGALRNGTIKSAIGMGSLLWAGIGDTIRVSLAAAPVEEIKPGFAILKSRPRHRGVNIIASPVVRAAGPVIRREAGGRLAIATPMSLPISGGGVNGPGEALLTDVGFTGGGKGAGMVYLAGKADHKLDNDRMVDHIVELVEAKAAELDAANPKALQAAE